MNIPLKERKPLPQMGATDKSEKETLLEKITSLSAEVSVWFLSIRIVGVLLMVACLGHLYALAQGLTSNATNLVIVAIMIGNQVFTFRTRTKQTKLNEMKKTYETKFGAIPSTK